MAGLEQETSGEAESLRDVRDASKSQGLDYHRRNSFLVRQQSNHQGYVLLQKLVDLRMVHLLRPSLTPGKAGERYEAYLLDYSFYLWVHRRHGLSELKIRANEPPKYSELRALPKIALDTLVGVPV